MRLTPLAFLLFSSGVFAGNYWTAIEELQFSKLADTFSDKKVSVLLEGYGKNLSKKEKSAVAVLITLGALDAENLSREEIAEKKVRSYVKTVFDSNPSLIGRIGDVSLFHHMAGAFEHSDLLSDHFFLRSLGERLIDGVITGFDLRSKGVFDKFPLSQTFIYSHSSLLHIRQLVVLLHSEGIDGWIYITPKLSSFLYRDGWESAPGTAITLANGERVVQGKEIAVLFHFDSRYDQKRFHEVVSQFAKRNTKDEAGLIENAWWQPFYYTSQAFEDFEPISLVVVSGKDHEATLTTLEKNAEKVAETFNDDRWAVRTDRVWVNPPFFRFLNGGYK